MTHGIAMTIGVDLGDRFSHLCALSAEGEVIREERIRSNRAAFEKRFRELGKARVVMEVGTHSPWVSRCLKALGHEVIVADARRLEAISKNPRKNDRNDAHLLARLARDPALLSPVSHASEAVCADRAVMRAREALVRARTMLVNTLRGVVKSFGERLPTCSARSFHRRVRESVPAILKPAAEPLLAELASLEAAIRTYDERIATLARERYPEVEKLRAIAGVGPLTSLAFVLAIEDPNRFQSSRDAGAFFGLTPRQDQSGERDPQLGITKAGNTYVRCLLVCAAQYILGPFGRPCDLKRWGSALAERGGKNAKKRAVIAVARKLAVLMHRLWVSGEAYDPNYSTRARAAAECSAA